MTNTKERLSYISVLRCIVVIVVVFGYAICIQANGMFSERSVKHPFGRKQLILYMQYTCTYLQ